MKSLLIGLFSLLCCIAWLFELGGGAMSDCKTSCLPMSHREALYTVAALHQCPLSTPEGDRRTIETAVNWIEEVIKPHSAGGPLPCVSGEKNAFQIMWKESLNAILARFVPLSCYIHIVPKLLRRSSPSWDFRSQLSSAPTYQISL